MATTVLRGGTIYSPADPFATAMLITDSVIAWIGSDEAAAAMAPANAELVDLAGGFVAPPFVDSNIDLLRTGLAANSAQLRTARVRAEVLDWVADQTRRGRGRPIIGWGLPRLADGVVSAAELDRAAFGGQVLLLNQDATRGLCSSSLCFAARLGKLTGWSPGHQLSDLAVHTAYQFSVASLSELEISQLQSLALALAAEAGIGAVHNISSTHARPPQAPGQPLVLANFTQTFTRPDQSGCMTEPMQGIIRNHSQGQLLSAEEVAEILIDCAKLAMTAYLRLDADQSLEPVLAGFRLAAAQIGESSVRSAHHRIECGQLQNSDIDQIAHWGVSVSAPKSQISHLPLAALCAAGITVNFGSAPDVTQISPWEAVRTASYLHPQPISVRGAFTAHTRGGWRTARTEGGMLQPGSPAHYVIWQVGDLRVQTPDDRIQSWSTDPRSGTQGLPDLSANQPIPRCVRTVIHGEVVGEYS